MTPADVAGALVATRVADVDGVALVRAVEEALPECPPRSSGAGDRAVEQAEACSTGMLLESVSRHIVQALS
jgi:hypothetical protein